MTIHPGMSAQLPWRAATLLRNRASDARSAAGDGPWNAGDPAWCDPHGFTYTVACSEGEAAHASWEECQHYIAAMHPGVGLALADLLDAVAEHVASHQCEAECAYPDGCDITLRAVDLARRVVGDS